jgi:hypothetical protein
VLRPAPAAAADSAPARYAPVEPCRLLDTRDPSSAAAGRAAAGAAVEIDVTAAACGVPADASAAAIVVTAVEPDGPGFVAAWPAGAPQPPTSVLNYRAGQVVANSQIVPLGAGGRLSILSLAATDLVVDVMGYFVPSGGPVAAGRFVAVEPARALDTRSGARPASAGTVRVVADVPDDALAVTVNITTADSVAPGFFTVHAAGAPRPTASVLNTDAARQTRSVFAIVPVSEAAFEVFTSAGDHVVVDVTGYFTGESASVSDDGLFVAADPARLVDTREPYGPTGGPRLWDGGSREFDVTGVTGGPVSAVAANVTMTDTEDAGFVVASAARTVPPATSSVNAESAQRTVANAAIIGVSTAGVRVSTLQATEVVVDITGWFTGEPVAGSGAAPVNEPSPDRRVFIIADSTMAGMRWNRTLAGLQGFEAITDLESCRRLVAPSCRGREGYTPPSLVAELRRLSGITPEDILVIGAGYDDWYGRFSSDFDVVVATARAVGFRHIAWPNFVVSNNYLQPGSLAPNYAAMNAVLMAKVATGQYPEVRVWDLDGYLRGTRGWLYGDGIHQRPLGSWGVADWISRHVRAFDDRPCAQPWRPGEPIADPCPNPDALAAAIGHPDIVGLYGL